jgi:tetratricopeptide (TPR) repeat protein
VAQCLNNLALLLSDTNRKSEAEPMYRRALSICDHSDVAQCLNNLALLLSDTNRKSEAEPMYRRALGILIAFRASTGHTHPNFELINRSYSLLLTELGNSPEQIAQTLDNIKNEIETKHG